MGDSTQSLSRVGTVTLALFILAAAVPVGLVAAQAAPEATVTIGDPAGDVDLSIAPRSAPQHANASQYGNGQFDHLDITRVVFGAETDQTFEVRISFKVLDAPQNSRPSRSVLFSYGRVDWQILEGGCPMFGQQQTVQPGIGCLRFRDASASGFRAVKAIAGSKSDGAFAWVVPKELVFNENRVPARYGESLRNLSAVALQYYFGGGGGGGFEPTGGILAVDRAPQESVSGKIFTFVKGSGGQGYLAMNSVDPIRVTNGEATTIVFKVDLHNANTQPSKVQLSVRNTIADWAIRAPSFMDVGPESTVSFPVILSMPFRHDHGRTALFTVDAEAIEDPESRASTDLGVFWTDVPQPSAHHECDDDATCGQWFHTSPFENPLPDQTDQVAPFKNVWFNGIAKDPAPNADDANVPAFFNDQFWCLLFPPNPTNCKAPPQWTASWFFPMSPQLLIGLDFDTTKQGRAKLTFVPPAPDTAARVEFKLLYCDPTKQGQGGLQAFGSQSSCYQYNTLLASGTATVAFPAPNQAVSLEVPLKVEPAADLIPYRRGANIGIDLRVISTVPENTILVPPRIEFVTKQSHLHLPLIEYHDPIDQAFEEVGLVVMRPLDPFEKEVNPGRTTLFRFELENNDDIAHHLGLEVQGVHNDWAYIVGQSVLLLEEGEKGNFTLAVAVPDDAAPDERAELFVVAQSQEESWVVTLSRLRARVVAGTDIPDEAGQVAGQGTGGGESPASGGAALVVAAVAAVWLVGRARVRRRG